MPTAVLTDFPLAPSGAVRQCAWCWLVVDHTGQYRLVSSRKIRTATHGICPSCKESMRAEIAGSPPELARAA